MTQHDAEGEGARAPQGAASSPPNPSPRVALRQEESGPILKPLASDADAPPSATGKYQIQGEIARGGVGIVLQAYDRELGRSVAIKQLRHEYRDNEIVRERFVEEAQIGGQLQHPGIAPVFDLSASGDTPFFAMRLIKGRTLAALMAEDRESPAARSTLLRVFEQVCQTMAYAHARAVIHRDLKPSNVMVGAFGEVQVVDWGMGKVLTSGGVADERRTPARDRTIVSTVRNQPGSSSSQSMDGSAMGTPGYMPPEQARGDVAAMDERSDVFSLGAILCEILTGQPPYVGTPYEQLRAAAQAEQAACLQRLAACDADDELKDIARACLVPASDARPRDAGVVAARVGAYLSAIEQRARSAEIAAAEERVKAVAARRSQRLTLALSGSVLLFLLTGGAVWWGVARASRAREERVAAGVTAALDDAILRQGRSDWAGATSAAERAVAMAAEATEDVRARAVEARAAIDGGARRAQARAEMLAGNAALLSALEDLRQPEGKSDDYYATDWRKLDEAYAALFARHGLILETGTVEAAAAALRAREVGPEMAAWLDDWAIVRQRAGRRDEASRLFRVSDLLDPEPSRLRLREAVRGGDLAELKRFAEPRALGDDSPVTAGLLAEALAKAGADDTAAEVLRAAYAAHPESFPLALDLARLLVRRKSHEEAARIYAAAHALRPRNIETLHEQGMVFEAMDDPAAALRLFQEAARGRPDDGHLQFHIAGCLGRLGREDEAGEALRASIRLDPGFLLSYMNMAIASFERRQPDAGIALLQEGLAKAKDARPRDLVRARGELALAHAMAGREADCEAELARASEVGVLPGLARAFRARAYIALGKPERDWPELRAAARLDPDSPSVLMQRRIALQALGSDEAFLVAERLHRLDPVGVDALAGVANGARADGRIEASLAAWERHSRSLPSRTNLSSLGGLYLQNGLAQDALRCFERALTLDIEREPEALRAQAADALLHQRLGVIRLAVTCEFGKAEAHFRKAVELDEGNGENQFFLASAILAQGRHAEALAHFDLARQQAAGGAWRYRDATEAGAARARKLAENESRYFEMMSGRSAPKDAEDAADAGMHALSLGRNRDALRLFGLAAELDPTVVGDLKGPIRRITEVRSVALPVALASARLLAEVPAPPDAQDLRRRAFATMAAEAKALDAALWAPTARPSPADRGRLRQHAMTFRDHPDLGPLRDEKEIDRLPDDDVKVAYAALLALRRHAFGQPPRQPER